MALEDKVQRLQEQMADVKARLSELEVWQEAMRWQYLAALIAKEKG